MSSAHSPATAQPGHAPRHQTPAPRQGDDTVHVTCSDGIPMKTRAPTKLSRTRTCRLKLPFAETTHRPPQCRYPPRQTHLCATKGMTMTWNGALKALPRYDRGPRGRRYGGRWEAGVYLASVALEGMGEGSITLIGIGDVQVSASCDESTNV